MAIYRTEHNKNYTVVNNFICKDKRLSWKAKGIWLYAFSRPDDWQFHFNDIVNQSIDGKDSVRAGLHELEKFGYLQRSRKRKEDGTLADAEWIFYEVPQLKENTPEAENPTLDNQTLDNPPLLSTDCLPSIEFKKERERPHEKKSYGKHEYVKLHIQEYEKAIAEYGPETVNRIIEELDLWLARGNGSKEKCHYFTLISFIKRAQEFPTKQNKKVSNDTYNNRNAKVRQDSSRKGEFVNGICVSG